MPRIIIDLLSDRTRPGVLRLYSDNMEQIGSWPCLGKSDSAHANAVGNPERLTTKEGGDTPIGTYRILGRYVKPATQANLRSYGPWPVIAIEGSSGDALKAKINGRRGLLIHGGSPRVDGGLRPTHGCIRVADSTMEALDRLFTVHGTPAIVIVEQVA